MSKRLSRKPADALARIDTTTRRTVAHILRTWAAATPAQIAAGAQWYGEAGNVAAELAAAGFTTREHAAAVIAHLSPRTPWARNVAGAFGLVLRDTAPACMARNISNAREALASDAPLDTLRGPKVAAFAANILGDADAVTVDVWAMRVAMGADCELDLDNAIAKAGVYDAIAHCYRLAARRVGVDPAVMQAVTWIVARNGRAS